MAVLQSHVVQTFALPPGVAETWVYEDGDVKKK
jgi:hypothetical protein